ncbi:unnamed protein product [Boreogadus saida]
MSGKSPADLPSSDHPESIAMRDEASKNYHICVDDIYTRVQKMDHAYKFGTPVCKQTIRYTEREKYFEGREKLHQKQVKFLRREVERLGEAAVENAKIIDQLGLDLATSQTDLNVTQNELDDLHLINASQDPDNLNCTTASQDTDSSQPRLDDNGNGDPLPGPCKLLPGPCK